MVGFGDKRFPSFYCTQKRLAIIIQDKVGFSVDALGGFAFFIKNLLGSSPSPLEKRDAVCLSRRVFIGMRGLDEQRPSGRRILVILFKLTLSLIFQALANPQDWCRSVDESLQVCWGGTFVVQCDNSEGIFPGIA
jgi:hypothetical protein